MEESQRFHKKRIEIAANRRKGGKSKRAKSMREKKKLKGLQRRNRHL
jgi:hypothetical protein